MSASASLRTLLSAPSPNADEILQASNAALAASKSDAEAQHAKVVALLRLDRFDDALRVFDECGDRLQQAARFEHAYALYKTGKLEEAAEKLEDLDERGARHLEAQACYRREDFASAARIYRQLWDSRQEDEESDLRINGGATDAQLEWARRGDLVVKKSFGREDLEAFETAYNAACVSLARGNLGAGELLLERARDLCVASELPEEEKKGELLPIDVQRLYVFSALGKVEQAEALTKEIAVDEIPEQSTKHIAVINKLTASTQSANPYMSHKIFNSLPSLPDNDRFYNFQSSLAKQNETTLNLLTMKFNGVIKSTSKTLAEQPPPTTSPRVNVASSQNAAAHAQNQLGKLGLKSILPLLKKRPKDVGLAATIVQLYVLTKNHGAAITVMESLLKHLEEESTSEKDQDVRFAPGLVALVVSLYSIEGRKSHIRAELAKAASYWRHKSKNPPRQLLRAAGMALLESGTNQDLAQAGEIFSTLRSHDPREKFATAGFVAAYATTQPSKISSKEIDQLTAINRLTSGIDAEALDQAGIAQLSEAASKSKAATSKKRPGADMAKPAKKRFRKSKMPKEIDLNAKPDPERWLPLRDRSSYRPKGKKGKQKQAALTQGGVSDKTEVGASEAPKASAGVVVGPGGGGAGAGGKNKKKKGKK